MSQTLPLVLASSSIYRRELLAKFGLTFTADSPDIDELRLANEPAHDLVKRLAIEKAHALKAKYPNHLIIGSDQVAVCRNQVLGKPHTRANAIAQLEQSSGETVTFLTGLCVLNSATGNYQALVEPFNVEFRQLSRNEIERYVDREQPFNCAGSFKSEGFGITLFARLQGDDPNSLIGLPLIRLAELLRGYGLQLP
ncbi:MAG: Maf family nucleotide pyrophosphatase [Gammaproteobacteria bacterium]|nr:Maf family nucleotide pyrophosphatase [Gammaproteobacteria bacterium]